MVKQAFILLFAILLTIKVDSTAINKVKPKTIVISPYDLIDEAEAQLEDLREITQGAIQTAFNNIDSLNNQALAYSNDIVQRGQLAIEQAYETIDGELTTLKDLANTAGKDISFCVNYREELLSYMPTYFINQLNGCITSSDAILIDILNDSRYFIGILINKVDDLEFQLGRCASADIFCISPIVTEIETAMVDLPQKVQIESDRALDLFGSLKATIQQCANEKISAAVGDGNTVLSEISQCANGILS